MTSTQIIRIHFFALHAGEGKATLLLTTSRQTTQVVNVLTLLPLAKRPPMLLLLTFELYTTLVRTGEHLLTKLTPADKQYQVTAGHQNSTLHVIFVTSCAAAQPYPRC